MASDTPQGNLGSRIAISVTKAEALALLEHVSVERTDLANLVRDVRKMAERRGWCAGNGARNSEVHDAPHDGSRERTAP